jgi:SAM-dependent methyltransferase
MDLGVYEAEARVEATHWWFTGRRKLFGRIIRELPLGKEEPVLDVGTSTGTNLRLLREMGFAKVTGLDMSEDAIRFCAEKGLGPVQLGDVTRMPFGDGAFSLVLATDIIEHIDDDARALAEIGRVLKPNGSVLFTVPAFMSLWGLQDVVSHHKRRYRRHDFLERVRAAGLEPGEAFYFNYLLFAPIWSARQLMKVVKPSVKSENELNPDWLNAALGVVFNVDTRTAPWLRPPFGVSILVLARKRA